MVRYIKDGAYTIVVDDVPSPSKKGDKIEDEASNKNPSRPSSPPKGDDDLGDNIDFANPEFVLQNLSIAMPTYEDDRTHMLQGRSDMADVIANQICFYVFCALQPFAIKPSEMTPQILILGDGFVGAKVIDTLAENECLPLMRIYTRGDIAAKEWRAKGFQAGSNLPALVNHHKPAIFVFCAEYSSFHIINHLLAELELLSPTACVITSTLGFQRKKLFHNLHIPTILRTYVEPQETLKSYRTKLQQQLQDLWKYDFKQRTNLDDEESEPGVIPASKSAGNTTGLLPPIGTRTLPDEKGLTVEGDEDSLCSETTDEEIGATGPVSIAEKSAMNILKRMQSVAPLLHLIENYYMLHDMSFAEARRLSLRVILGYISVVKSTDKSGARQTSRGSKRRDRSRGATTSQQSKRAQVVVRIVEKICLSLLNNFAKDFHQEFSKSVSMRDLATWDEEPSLVEGAAVSVAVPELMVDEEGRHFFQKDDKLQRLCAPDKINSLLSVDEDYSFCRGAPFDYMRALDTRTRGGPLDMSGMFRPLDEDSV